jgi:Predicted pyridoxal phosphate-dependent enzyme apparently involved in regulation of cell wall biogenesis
VILGLFLELFLDDLIRINGLYMNKIWLSSPHMGGNEMKYVQEAYDTNWVAPLGPNVNEFEKELASYLSANGVAALSSGTAALHLALIMLGVQRGDEVICQSFTFSASANPIAYQGAIPVFVDSESETWNMDPVLLEEAITDRIKREKKPKAIIVVHLYGMPAKMEEILTIANRYEIPVIEDAAEALGSSYRGQGCGSIGTIGILSFNGNKIITTSGGGALVSNSIDYVEKSRFLSTQARDNAPHYQHTQIGYNYRMSNIVAGIGRGQLEVLPSRIEARRANNGFYRELLKGYDYISFQNEPMGHYSNYWLTSIIVGNNDRNIDRERIRLSLEKANIETRPLWKPMHLQPVFTKCSSYLNGVSERFFKDGLCLPSGSNLTDDERNRISKALKEILQS